ncbi:WD repeat-containing protein 5B-like [Brachionichthys hirsutus]|uniref:WD repeat-containing protein 5B-like n=1 Tax=Brachionichthys hirsutus TaxID=412623 RepID=UPI0036048665
MNYWSNGSKAVFSFGDICGNLSVFISYSVKEKGLFCKEAYEQISLMPCPTVYQKNLLRNPSKDFQCIKFPIFQDVCSQVRYFPSLDSFAVCGNSSQTMVLAALAKSHKSKVTKRVYNSDKRIFNCVEYAPSVESLVTGGDDGILRIWSPDTAMCKKELTGHSTAVTHIRFNPYSRTIISVSKDMNVRLWSQNAWLCLQSLQVEGMGREPLSSMCYNPHNNALILANSDIATCLGRGTDVFGNMLTSHDNRISNVLYHAQFKQVITACQTGVVTVWDIFTGQPLLEFKVTPNHVRLTAMSFDEPQRRLITVSDDGKLKVWNFNSGSEIAVCPVSLPNEMTNILCLNNRVFVSGKDSKIVFNLDMKESGSRFLEHGDLNDISSMAGYKSTLVTASSSGNIVIWDANSAKALYLLNGTAIPQCQTEIVPLEKSQEKHSDSSRKSMRDKSTGSLFLSTRADRDNTATLLISADDYIYAWSVTSNVAPLGKFRAVQHEDAVITTMSTDANEEILLTGDSIGNIFLWDMKGFGHRFESDLQTFCEEFVLPVSASAWVLSGVSGFPHHQKHAN